MEQALTYKDLAFSFARILHVYQLDISEKPGEHGFMNITALLDWDFEGEIFFQVPEILSLLYKDGGEEKPLFSGMLLKSQMKRKGRHLLLSLQAAGHTYCMDIRREIRSFQNLSETIFSIMDAVTGDYPGCICQKNAQDSTPGQLLFQYEETDWEFLKRLFSMYHTALYARVDRQAPCFMAGLPNAKEDPVVQEKFFSVGLSFKTYEEISRNEDPSVMTQQYISYQAESYEILFLGSKITYRDRDWYVHEVRREMRKGILVSIYTLVQKEAERCPLIKSMTVPGISLDGTIKSVTRDRVQVLMERDQNSRTAGQYWFPYSTVAGSADGSGWYCMPENGEKIRVYFPTWNEKEAYVISALSGNTLGNQGGMDPAVRHISTAQGNTVSFTGGGTDISVSGGAGAVSLGSGGDLVISAASSLSMCAGSKISFSANEIVVTAADKVGLASDAGSSIQMTSAQIDVNADKIRQN